MTRTAENDARGRGGYPSSNRKVSDLKPPPRSADYDAPMNTTPWECPRCGKTATVNLDALGVLGVVRCTCGSASRVIPPGKGQVE